MTTLPATYLQDLGSQAQIKVPWPSPWPGTTGV